MYLTIKSFLLEAFVSFHRLCAYKYFKDEHVDTHFKVESGSFAVYTVALKVTSYSLCIRWH